MVRNFRFPAPDLIGATNTGGTDAATLNAVERQAGLPVQGTVEPGSSVTLTVGTWSQTIPASQNVTTTYPIAIVTSAPNPVAAAAFVSYVRYTTSAQGILRAYGFAKPW